MAGSLPLHLLRDNATVTDGRLAIRGVDVIELAERYGTPLFVYDGDHLRARCREAVTAFGPGVACATKVVYATSYQSFPRWPQGIRRVAQPLRVVGHQGAVLHQLEDERGVVVGRIERRVLADHDHVDLGEVDEATLPAERQAFGGILQLAHRRLGAITVGAHLVDEAVQAGVAEPHRRLNEAEGGVPSGCTRSRVSITKRMPPARRIRGRPRPSSRGSRCGSSARSVLSFV